MGGLFQDLQYAVRMLAKRPGFTAVIVLTLALGIGANTAIFSVIDAVVLRPLHFEEPDRLVMLWEMLETQEGGRGSVSYPNFEDWRTQSQSFEGMSLLRSKGFTLPGVEQTERINGARVSADFFPLLRVEAALGRTLVSEDDQVGAEKVVVLSDGLWRRRFGADPDLLGRTLPLDGEAFTVIGVLPPGFRFPGKFSAAELWTSAVLESMFLDSRGAHGFQAVARLKPGVTMDQASAELNTIARRLQLQYPDTNVDRGVELVPLHEQVVGSVRPALFMLFGAVALVLLIACANVANLFLARCADRERELAVRTAVGAGRLRLVRQLLTESVLLGLLGGSLGVVLALWSIDVLVALMPSDLPRAEEIALDGRVLSFALILSLCTSLVFGLAPALRATPSHLPVALKESGREMATGGRGRLRGAFVVCQVALALMLLIGAGLLMRSFHRLMSVDTGFRPENMLTFQLSVPRSSNLEAVQRAELYREVLARIAALPAVESACANAALPLTDNGIGLTFTIDGRSKEQSDDWVALYGSISPDYFRTMGIPLLTGRSFTELDVRDKPGVMVINERMARRFWPDGSPLGERLRVSVRFGEGEPEFFEIVGVVGDVRDSILDEPEPHMYVPFAQQTWPFISFALRTASDPVAVTASVRREVADVTREIPPYAFRTFDQYIADTVAQRRFATVVLSVYAFVAFILAIIGLYGVLSYAVAQRTHEIGVRVALGAQRSDVLRLVLRQGSLLTGVGLGLGLAGAFAATRVLSSLLFGITAGDPATFAAVSVLLAAVALLATYIPAHRATTVDPMVALRYE